jgi:hypothetical protein
MRETLCHLSDVTTGSKCGQINELSDIARCIANMNAGDENALEYMRSCMEDLKDVLHDNKVQALTVDTFGKRIDKLCRCVLNHTCFGADLAVL